MDTTQPLIFLRNPVSAATHLVWFVGALFITLLLWRLTRGDRLRRWSVLTFGLSMCLLYAASGTYHAIRCNPGLLQYFRLIDHSAVYVLIAGTYTPVFAVVLRGRLRVLLLSLVWLLAGLGIAAKWSLTAPPHPVTVGFFIALGWIGLVPIVSLIRAIGLIGMGWALAGGLLYTTGAIFDVVNWPVIIPRVVGAHEVVHVMDMGATLIHVYFVVRFVLPVGR
jgi:hemolysin III